MESSRVFLVETYVSKPDMDGAPSIAERAILTAEEMRCAGATVR